MFNLNIYVNKDYEEFIKKEDIAKAKKAKDIKIIYNFNTNEDNLVPNDIILKSKNKVYIEYLNDKPIEFFTYPHILNTKNIYKIKCKTLSLDTYTYKFNKNIEFENLYFYIDFKDYRGQVINTQLPLWIRDDNISNAILKTQNKDIYLDIHLVQNLLNDKNFINFLKNNNIKYREDLKYLKDLLN